jgi:CRISPR-associated endonuclease/helicase Cas3
MINPPLAHSPRKGTKARNFTDAIDPQTYKKHIDAVCERANTNAERATLYFKGDVAAFLDTVNAAAIYHDLGKLDQQNQAVLSAIAGGGLPVPHEDAGVTALLQLKRNEAAALVLAHHAGLFDAEKETAKKTRAFRDVRSKPSVSDTVADHVDGLLSSYCALHAQAGMTLLQQQNKMPLHKDGFSRRIALSCLVDADHGDTAQNYRNEVLVEAVAPRWEERLTALNIYVKSLQKQPPEPRDALRDEVYTVCRDAPMDGAVRSCDAAVGSGKTTAVMGHLLRAAQERGLRHIIVVLPFTNIIKQSVEIYRKALTLPDERPEDVVAEHHHRADFGSIEVRQLATLWRAPIIVTTAVQFFETLASHHPARLRKLHELPGSAVFVDKVHNALPAHLWGQVWLWLETWTQQWGGYLVLASGSLPRFWGIPEMEELIGTSKHVPDLLTDDLRNRLNAAEQTRIRYRQIEKPLSIDGLLNKVQEEPGPRLVILNTVQSAAVVAEALRGRGQHTMHLSTALAPQDRDRIVERVLARLHSSFTDWTLIATSCVEAGMNFSFRSGFRERATTSSLIQVGGRVSRGQEFDDACVWDFLIEDNLITANPDLKLARKVLKGLLESDEVNVLPPGELAKIAMQRELTEGDLERARELIQLERLMRYPCVSQEGKVIETDTRTVVIDAKLAEAIRNKDKVSSRALQRGSVQMWTSKIDKGDLPLVLIAGKADEYDAIYEWTAEYDPDFLGYMAGALPFVQKLQEGIFIV